MPINPDFSALEAVITAKVNNVATNIDNKDLLIQMKALEAAVANLALTRVISEGTYQQGQVLATASTASTTLSTAAAAASATLSTALSSATTTFNTTANAAIANINTLLTQLGSVNASAIITSINEGLASITAAARTATGQVTTARADAQAAILQLQTDAVGVISGAGTSALNNAVSGINTARDAAILAVSASGDLTNQIDFIRNDRWLGLNIFAPTSGN